jgi:3-hydroxybutyryl-CoA dehydrogenase
LTKDHQNQQARKPMKILAIGETTHFNECKARFGGVDVLEARSHQEAMSVFNQCVAVFDFIIDEDTSQLYVYSACPVPVFLNSAKSSLQQIVKGDIGAAQFFGFNGLPTFFNRPVLEVVLRRDTDRDLLAGISTRLDLPYEIVPDRPGMVSARIVSMIVNEAFSAMEDGTASPGDIDLAMKLGTNYPRGPVEWGRQIGLKNICDVLDALYAETGSQRYTICNLLREEAKRE